MSNAHSLPANKPRGHMAPEELARSLEDIRQRAAEVHHDLKHLCANFTFGPGPFAQIIFAQRSVSRAAESLEIGARLALEVKA